MIKVNCFKKVKNGNMSEMSLKRPPFLLSRKMFDYLEIYFAGYFENPENVTLNTYRKYFCL
jgi:hypothetical protein